MLAWLTYTDLKGDTQWSWIRLLVVWVILNSSIGWYTIYANRKVKYTPIRDDKYKPFVRMDYDHWHYWLVPFTHFFWIPRLVVGFLLVQFVAGFAVIICLGFDPKKLPPWRKTTLLYLAHYGACIVSFLAGYQL